MLMSAASSSLFFWLLCTQQAKNLQSGPSISSDELEEHKVASVLSLATHREQVRGT
jgi:hypothetical protein